MHARQVEQGVDARAVATRLSAARRRLSHRRGPSVGSLVAPDPEGPRPTSTGPTRPSRLHTSPPRNPKSPIRGCAMRPSFRPDPVGNRAYLLDHLLRLKPADWLAVKLTDLIGGAAVQHRPGPFDQFAGDRHAGLGVA